MSFLGCIAGESTGRQVSALQRRGGGEMSYDEHVLRIPTANGALSACALFLHDVVIPRSYALTCRPVEANRILLGNGPTVNSLKTVHEEVTSETSNFSAAQCTISCACSQRDDNRR